MRSPRLRDMDRFYLAVTVFALLLLLGVAGLYVTWTTMPGPDDRCRKIVQVSAARLTIGQRRMNSRPATSIPAPKTTTRASWANWNRSSIAIT